MLFKISRAPTAEKKTDLVPPLLMHFISHSCQWCGAICMWQVNLMPYRANFVSISGTDILRSMHLNPSLSLQTCETLAAKKFWLEFNLLQSLGWAERWRGGDRIGSSNVCLHKCIFITQGKLVWNQLKEKLRLINWEVPII